MKSKIIIIIIYLFTVYNVNGQTKINRYSLVHRHNVVNNHFDSLSSLSVGNGRFAFTVDVTGLQSFRDAYGKGVPLERKVNGAGIVLLIPPLHFRGDPEELFLHGRNIPYSVEIKTPERNKEAVNWFRQNPHRLQSGNIGFDLLKKDGSTGKI